MTRAALLARTRPRLWRVDVNAYGAVLGLDFCRLWVGATRHGYPAVRVGSKVMGGHRLMLEAKLGRPLRAGAFACHHCDNPGCMEPRHLYEGDASRNMLDAYRRGQKKPYRPRGEANGRSKLSRAKVRAIRASGAPAASLAVRYGVTPDCISQVRAGRRWGWLVGG